MIIQQLKEVPFVALPSQGKELYAFSDRLYLRDLSYPDAEGNITFSETEIFYDKISNVTIVDEGGFLTIFFYVKNSFYKVSDCEYRAPIIEYNDKILFLKDYIEKNYIFTTKNDKNALKTLAKV